MIVGSASRIHAPVSISLDERDALRRHLVHTDGVWTWGCWDLATFAMKWADACRLLADLDRDADPRATLELMLPPDVLHRVFTDIRDGLFVIDGLDPEQALIVAGVCERVLGAGAR